MLDLQFTTGRPSLAGRPSGTGRPRHPAEFPGPSRVSFADRPALAEPRARTRIHRVGRQRRKLQLRRVQPGTALPRYAHRMRRHVTSNATALSGLTPVPPALAVLVTVRPERLGEVAAGAQGRQTRATW